MTWNSNIKRPNNAEGRERWYFLFGNIYIVCDWQRLPYLPAKQVQCVCHDHSIRNEFHTPQRPSIFTSGRLKQRPVSTSQWPVVSSISFITDWARPRNRVSNIKRYVSGSFLYFCGLCIVDGFMLFMQSMCLRSLSITFHCSACYNAYFFYV
jgi:hypothetical protein